uniref:NADH dehydrogenase subunit 6 n=1 Tax=Austromenopon paululum TaxID=2965261 RepID=UPI0026E38846|nr:NADH dehydrogenase subunit 6 [Austromenopon paululum]WJJ69862.1 NADH dehydrogenase subunit 6 [Austromenopon paululum]
MLLILTFFLSQCFLFFSYNLVAELILLFLFMVFLLLVCYFYTLKFLATGLVMIVMLTGLFVVFAFLTSLAPQSPSLLSMGEGTYWPMVVTLSILWVTSNLSLHPGVGSKTVSSTLSLTGEHYSLCTNFMVTASILLILLLLVVVFIQMTHGKSGSLRKTWK